LRWIKRYGKPAGPPLVQSVCAIRPSDWRYDLGRGVEQPEGEWIRYGEDGQELWRGTLSAGSGTLAEFFPNGQKQFEIVLKKNIAVAYREWDIKGTLVREEELLDDGVQQQVEYRKKGKPRKERWSYGEQIQEVLGEPRMARITQEKLYDPDGQAIAANIKELSANLNERFEKNKEEIDETMISLNTSMKHLASITENVDERLTLNERYIDETVLHLHTMSVNLDEFSEDLKLNPWKLMYREKSRPKAK
jgi:hypothetical protein